MIKGGRQINRESRTIMQFRLHRDKAVMIFDDRVGGGEAKTSAFRLGCKIRVEDALEIVVRDPDTFVADTDSNVISRR